MDKMCGLETGDATPHRKSQPYSKGKDGQDDDTQHKGGIWRKAVLIILELFSGGNPIREAPVNYIDNRKDQ
jgi:hypothetical protein